MALTKFRLSVHSLEIETGRHSNISRENRLCTKCNLRMIENEYHFILVCPLYIEIRKHTLNRIIATGQR